MTISNLNPLGYTGLKEKNPPNITHFRKDPTAFDITGFDIGDIWINTATQVSWQLLSKANNIAVWSQVAGGAAQVSTLTGDDAVSIAPLAGNINVIGSNGITTSNSAPNTLQAANTATLTPNAGGAVTFVGGTINLLGNGAQGVSTTGSPATVTISVQDATTAVKGVARFSTNDFSVGAGVVTSKSGWILLSSKPAANVATIDFTNLPAFRNFALVCRNVTPSTNGEHLYIMVSQDNGATWLAAGYESGINYTLYNSAVITNENVATSFLISGSINNATDYESVIYILNANMPDACAITGTATWSDQALGATAFGTIGGRSNTGINAFRFIMTAHAIDTGNFSLYGIRE